jgi:hypothetical protein
MDEAIKRLVRQQKIVYALFWIAPLLIVAGGECGAWAGNASWEGIYAANSAAVYYGETLVILLTAGCVPLSLKLFAWVVSKKIRQVTISRALPLYARWSLLRMGLLALPLFSGLALYYLMMSNKCALCAAIALTASLFCVPGEERLRKELDIDKDVDADMDKKP